MKRARTVLFIFVILVSALALIHGHTAKAQGDNPGLIVFTSDRGGNFDIYVLDPETGQTTQLTNDPGNDVDPVWSPDGSYIAFASNRDGDYELFVMQSDGSDPLQLTNNEAEDRFPRWQPDGDHIVYVSDVNGQPDLYVISFKTAQVRQLTNDKFDERGPGFGAAALVSATPGVVTTPFATIQATSAAPDAIVTSASLNVRENPGAGAGIVTAISSGTQLHIIGRYSDNSWLQVVAPGNITGWVSAPLVQINIDLNTVPIVNAPFIAPPPTATPPQVPPSAMPVIISFTVDRDTITAGQCVTFTWVTQGIKEVYFQGTGVVGNASQQVCPTATTTYNLAVTRLDGVVDTRYITITVNP